MKKIYDDVLKKDIEFAPRTQEEYISLENCRKMDAGFAKLSDRCCAPGCDYPLPIIDRYRISNWGWACNVCYEMYLNVRVKIFFIDAHRLDQDRSKGG